MVGKRGLIGGLQPQRTSRNVLISSTGMDLQPSRAPGTALNTELSTPHRRHLASGYAFWMGLPNGMQSVVRSLPCYAKVPSDFSATLEAGAGRCHVLTAPTRARLIRNGFQTREQLLAEPIAESSCTAEGRVPAQSHPSQAAGLQNISSAEQQNNVGERALLSAHVHELTVHP